MFKELNKYVEKVKKIIYKQSENSNEEIENLKKYLEFENTVTEIF